jgi:hypothetical protein
MNTATEPISTTRSHKKPIWRWVLLGAIALIVIGVILNATHRPPTLPPVMLFPPGYRISPQKVPIPDRWIPRSWSWLWRVKERVLGRPKTITIGASVVEFTAPPQEVLSGFTLPEPTFTNLSGFSVWIADDALMAALRERLGISQNGRVAASPRITTADGMHASLSTGSSVPINGAQTRVGVILDLLPRVRRDSTDLTAILTCTEAVANNPTAEGPAQSVGPISVRTNFAVAARIQIPKGSGVLMLDARPSLAGGTIHGIMISANSDPANFLPQNAVLRRTITRVATPPSPPRP